jgi:hypothetical protein
VVAAGTQAELLASCDRYRSLFSFNQTVEAAGGHAAGAMLMGNDPTALPGSNRFRQAYERTCEMLGVKPLPAADSISLADLGAAAGLAAEIAARSTAKTA